MSMKPRAASNILVRKRQRALSAALAACVLGATVLPAPLVQAQQRNTRFRGEPVTLNFVNADIEGVARAMGVILKQAFVVDPRVRGNITLYSEQPLTPAEAYRSFLAALRGLGFTVVEVGGLYKVVPEADAKLQTGTVSVGEVSRRGDQVITQIFKLSYENANSLVPVLRPLISPNNTINANPGTNSLVITDYADNLQRIGKIIAALDTPSSGDIQVIPLQHAVAADVAALVQRLTEGGPTPGAPPGTPQALSQGSSSILVDQRSNSLIVRATNPARMAAVRDLVDKLDRPIDGAGATGNIWVVHLKNADATRLAAVLRAAFASAAGPGSIGANSGGGSFTQTAAQTATPTATNAAGTSAAATTPIAPAAAPSTGGFIQADPATNSLVITAPEPLYRQVRAMIDQLDSRRAQVYIESMIVEVSGDNAADFGFQWQGLIGNRNDKNFVIGGTNFGTNNNIIPLAGAIVGGRDTAAQAAAGISEGLNIGLVRDYGGILGLSAIARMLQSQTNVNIVSTPNLITLDNEEAKIIVGSNVPFVTGQFTATGTAATNPFQTIERKDVGITLRIRPQIGENGVVRMTIFQESSSLSDKVAPGTSNAGPSTNKRSIESNVVVDDGQIIVLGGLIEDRYNENKSKVPLLGDIPYVGGLFRSESRSKTRTNLMVFLRPVVMRDAESTQKLSLDRYDLIRAQQKEAQPSPSLLIPINEAPVIPPMRLPLIMPPPVMPVPGIPYPGGPTLSEPTRMPPVAAPPAATPPLAVPPSSPGTEPNPAIQPPAPRPPAAN
jgi:general secretion pathway protein D